MPRGPGGSRKILPPDSDFDSDVDEVSGSSRALTTEELLEEVSSRRKRPYENDSESDMNHESELDYVGESEEAEDALSESEHDGRVSTGDRFESKQLSAKKPRHDAYDKHLKTVTTTRPSSTLPKKKTFTKNTTSRSHSAPAPPRKASTSTSSGGSTRTPLSRGVASKAASRHLPITRKDTSPPSSGSSTDASIAATLKEISNTLSKVVNQIDRQESRLDSMEKKLSNCSSVSSSSSESGPKKIPPIVRAEVHRVYRSLCEEGENFAGFDLDPGVAFKDQQNSQITDKLIREVKAANPAFQSGLIRRAAYTYYRSLSQEASLERRGKKDQRDRTRRQRERLNRKLKERLSVLEKSRLSDENKRSWSLVMIPEFMSSESSCSDTDDDVLIKRQLPWRSEKVTDFFYKLDSHSTDNKSTRAKRQMKSRVLSGEPSTREIPDIRLPSWAVNQD